MAHPLLELIEITKRFRSSWAWRTIHAVKQLSLTIRGGEIYGLIGHNGAGKTTTLKLLVGLLRPTQGRLLWDGRPLEWDRPRHGIGFSPEQPYFYDHLSVRETLNFYGQLYGLSAGERRRRINELAEEFHIAHKLHAPMRTLSKGTLQRVAVAQAIIHRPRLAILDEPMSGLDPSGRKAMRELISSMRRRQTTVLFSSHILTDAEALCDRVAILAAGELCEVVDLHDPAIQPTSYTLVVTGACAASLEALSRMAAEPLAGGPQRWTVKLKDTLTVRAALAALQSGDACIEALLPERPSLEQHFLRSTNEANAT